jgi:hypothetical protein
MEQSMIPNKTGDGSTAMNGAEHKTISIENSKEKTGKCDQFLNYYSIFVNARIRNNIS